MIMDNTEQTRAVIGNRIKTLRESNDTDQGYVREHTGLTKKRMTQIENGELMPTDWEIAKIACALEVPSDAIRANATFEQDRRHRILYNAIAAFGEDHQIDKAIEELSELIQALCKWKTGRDILFDDDGRAERYDHVLEEMADVMIMLDQLKIIFEDPVDDQRTKIDRLATMVNGQLKKKGWKCNFGPVTMI